MFNEDEDWNDEQDARVLSETVLKSAQKTINTGVKPKAVGKKSLLRTLQTLGAVPEWKSDSHKQSSDSEVEAPPSHSTKKKRRKKREHLKTLAEPQDNGDLDEKPATKKKKKDNNSGAPKTNGTTADNATKSANMEVDETDIKKLSRQQWKNKMKNKRKCKNKYRENESEEKVNEVESVGRQETNEVKTDLNSSKKISQTAAKKKKKDNEAKPQKLPKEDTLTPREEKQQIQIENTKKSGEAEKVVAKSFPDDSKHKADEAEVEITDDQQHAKRLTTELSKKEIQKRDKLRKMLHNQRAKQHQSLSTKQEDEAAAPDNQPQQTQPASFRSRMEQRLESARFRYINEVLYSTTSGEAKRMFKQDPQAFWIYHKGYTAQVQKWPSNPVDAIISYIRRKPSSLVVADFGCGDCKIARSVTNKVHSFDLAATCELVTVCDMANVPLDDSSVDIAVFCLSLMGTNVADFISEANRVLKMGGVLKISEVASRFENVRSFLSALAKLGFKTASKDTDNTHFYSFEFVKTGNCLKSVKESGLQLKVCVYKKR